MPVGRTRGIHENAIVITTVFTLMDEQVPDLSRSKPLVAIGPTDV